MDSESGSLRSGWTDLVAGKLAECNEYCSFAFRKGWVPCKDSRKTQSCSVVLKANAYCTFSDCNVTCKCVATQVANGIVFRVVFDGDLRHKCGEKKARRIKGARRDALKDKIANKAPSALYSKAIGQLAVARLRSGNRDETGRSVHVFQKISSEARLAERRSENLIESLLVLKEEFNESTGRRRVQGYIQRIHCWPFSIMCFTEIGVRIYHYCAKKQPVHCDATGTIVQLQRGSPSPLYYALVVQQPKGFGPVAVAELITNEHNITSLSHFLECFRRAEAMVFGWQNVIMPKQIVIDRSMVLLNSFLKVYNAETISAYLHRCFRVVNGSAEEDDYTRVFVLACVSHVMHSAKNLCRRIL